MINRIKIIIIIIFYSLKSFSQFQEKSKLLNIEHIQQTAHLMGGGATFFDFNSDGFLDLYVTGGGNSDKLYKNLGNGEFYDVSLSSLISSFTETQLTSGVISGDINNDGCRDLFITTMDDTGNILLLNKCDGTFEDVSLLSGILEKSASMGATFLDINNDGFLDIYVINYIKESKFIRDNDGLVIGFEHECFPSLLYLNDGEGTFIESAKSYGVDNVGCGLAVAATDINNDGNVDIYIANDFGEWVVPNTAYKNNFPDENFTDISSSTNLDVQLYGMGIAVGDYDNDLDNDFYVSNLGRNNLLNNRLNNDYEDVTTASNVENEVNEEGDHHTSWGTLFLDIDNDGDLDLFVSNGFVGAAPFLKTALDDPNKMYLNNGNGEFADISEEYSVVSTFYNRGAVYGDYDNDGDLDIFCVSVDGSNNSTAYSLFYENQLEGDMNWLEVLLEGTDVNLDAYGALVTVYFNGGAIIREIYGGGTYASQNSTILHFGLNEINSIDSLKVRWNGDHHQTFYDIPVNQKIFIKENSNNYEIAGCTQESNPFFNGLATYNTGCFVNDIFGCTDVEAINYDSTATISNNQCIYEVIITGNKDLLSFSELAIYPSYFSNRITVDLENKNNFYSIYIYDIRGKIIFMSDIEGKKSISIETSSFLNGVYFMKVIDNKNLHKTRVRKIIKN